MDHTITNGTAHEQKPSKRSLLSHSSPSFGLKEVFVLDVIIYIFIYIYIVLFSRISSLSKAVGFYIKLGEGSILSTLSGSTLCN